MQQLGIYEQLITQLISSRLDRNRFYIGEREIDAADATVRLSRFLSQIIEYAIALIPSGENQLSQQISLCNELILWLKHKFTADDFFSENLLDTQGRILTAVYELNN